MGRMHTQLLQRAAHLACAVILSTACALHAQTPSTPQPPPTPSIPTATLSGTVTDTDAALINAATITLEETTTKIVRTTTSDTAGSFTFLDLPAGNYKVKITATGFSPWNVANIELQPGQTFTLPTIALGVEAITSTVQAIFQEDLAEVQISAEEHQRILGILPNFYVSYLPDAQPLTRRQKFKLARVVSTDPVTFFTTGVTAGIEQWQGDFEGYGQGFSGYAQRYAATYGDRLSSTFLGAALLPSLLHQDPRYFYKGTGGVVRRALYAISTTVICKGDNGHWQPNYSNVFGNLGAAGISTLYYPASDRHSVQVTVDNTLLGVATGAFGTLFQEFLLRHLTHGAPKP
jgi:hypothetical protein